PLLGTGRADVEAGLRTVHGVSLRGFPRATGFYAGRYGSVTPLRPPSRGRAAWPDGRSAIWRLRRFRRRSAWRAAIGGPPRQAPPPRMRTCVDASSPDARPAIRPSPKLGR